MTYKTILVNLEAGRSNAHLLTVAKQVTEKFQAEVIGSTACAPIQSLYGNGYAYGDIFEQDSKEIAAAKADSMKLSPDEPAFWIGGRPSRSPRCPTTSRTRQAGPTWS